MQKNDTELGSLDRAIESLRSIYEHRQRNPTTDDELLYYKAMLKYLTDARNARREGKLLVSHSAFVPTEILYAMDMVPWHNAMAPGAMANATKSHQELLKSGAAYGLPQECCSAHLMAVGALLKGWLPPFDAFVSAYMGCDMAAIGSKIQADLCNAPCFDIEAPTRNSEKDIEYYVGQLENLISFLEEKSHQKLDPGKLKEAVRRGVRTAQVWQDIGEIRKATPAPMRNRSAVQQYLLSLFMAGSQDVLDYFEAVRRGVQDNVRNKRGPAPKEKHRVLTLFLPPLHYMKMLDWLEKEQGAVSVMETHACYWGDAPLEFDPDRPLESLARKSLRQPMLKQLHGGMEALLSDIIKQAREYRADVAFYYASITCRTSPATIRAIKEALMEQVHIPMMAIDCDSSDPTYTPEDKLKDSIKDFLSTVAS